MPFITDEHREDGHTPCTPGDLCYGKYLPLIRAWNKERRWTTAHELFKEGFELDNDETAKLLAFLVFFVKEVMPYEYEKEKENGEIK